MSRYTTSADVIDLTSSPSSSSKARPILEDSDTEIEVIASGSSIDRQGQQQQQQQQRQRQQQQQQQQSGLTGPPPSEASTSGSRPHARAESADEASDGLEWQDVVDEDQRVEVAPTPKGKGKAKAAPTGGLFKFGFKKKPGPAIAENIVPRLPKKASKGKAVDRGSSAASHDGPEGLETEELLSDSDDDFVDAGHASFNYYKLKYKDSLGRPDYRSNPRGALAARIEDEVERLFDRLFGKSGPIANASTSREELLSILRKNAPAAFAFFSKPEWTDREKQQFLPEFLDVFSRHVAVAYALAMSESFEDRTLLSALQLFSIEPKSVVLLLASAYRTSIGAQSFILARALDSDISPSSFLGVLDENETSGVNYLKIVHPSYAVGGNSHLTSSTTIGSYCGETICPRDRQNGYKSEVKTTLSKVKKMLTEGVPGAEIKDVLGRSFRFFTRFLLGDPEVEPNKAIPLPLEAAIETYKLLKVPSSFWLVFGVHAALETVDGIATASYGSTAIHYEKWAGEMENSSLALPFDLARLQSTAKRVPLMRELPIAPNWGADSRLEQQVNAVVAVADLVGAGLQRRLLQYKYDRNRYCVTLPSMATLGGAKFQVITLGGPSDIGSRRNIRLSIDADAKLAFKLIAKTSVRIDNDGGQTYVDFDQEEDAGLTATQYPTVLIHHLLDQVLRSNSVEKLVKKLPDLAQQAYKTAKAQISPAGWEAVDASLTLPSDPKALRALLNEQKAKQIVGEEAFSGSLRLNTNKVGTLLLHSPPGAKQETVTINLQKKFSEGPTAAASAAKPPGTKGAPPVFVNRKPPYQVYDANGSEIIASLVSVATKGVKKKGVFGKGGRDYFLDFVQAMTEGPDQEYLDAMDRKRRYRRRKAMESYHRRKGEPEFATDDDHAVASTTDDEAGAGGQGGASGGSNGGRRTTRSQMQETGGLSLVQVDEMYLTGVPAWRSSSWTPYGGATARNRDERMDEAKRLKLGNETTHHETVARRDLADEDEVVAENALRV